MRLPTDLPHEIAERVDPPDFDAVLTRARSARQRRRRTTIASGLAAACAVGGLAFAVGDPLGSDNTSPRPAPPGPSETYDGSSEVDPRLPADVQEILESDRVDVFDISASDGAVAALWAACSGATGAHLEGCRSALVIKDGADVHGLVLTGDPRFITPVPGGWLVAEETGPVRIGTSGERQRIYTPGGNSADVQPGDTALPPLYSSTVLRGDKIVPAPTPNETEVLSAYVTPDGRLIVATSAGAGISISATADGRVWETQMSARTTLQISAAVVSGNGDHVAVAFLGDATDGSIPLRDVRVSHDAGATWEWARGLDVEGADGLRNLSSLAVSAEGSSYVTTESHGLIRIDPDGNVLPANFSSHDRSLFTTDDGVCFVTETGRVDELRCSEDDGTTWTSLSLPGFR